MENRILLIMIRNPIAGKVKSRLAATTGPEQALEIYRLLLEHTRQAALKVNATRWVFYSDFVDEQDEWSAADFIKKQQSTGDIGRRMSAALAAVQSDNGSMVLIGSDVPGLQPEILESAFRQLEHHDYVLGPATDGGYYLIGMKKYEPSVFEGITWSTAAVMPQTLAKITRSRSSYFLLPVLSDVDEEEDWIRHGKALPGAG